MYKFPDEIAARLAPYASRKKIEPVLKHSEDFAHGQAHLIPMVSNTLLIAQEGNHSRRWAISNKDAQRLERAALTHDMGYRFVPDVLKAEEHQYGSALIAWLLYQDEAIVEAILLHVQDTMPDNIPYWMRVLQDGDRISRLGWPMVEWAATYLGYSHPVLEKIPKRALTQTHNYLWDLRHPRQGVKYKEKVWHGCWVGEVGLELAWTDYEHRVEKFARRKIFPYLTINSLLPAMLDVCEKCMSWFDGEEDSVSEQGWTIAPVGEMAAALFEYKIYNTLQVYRALLAIGQISTE